MSEMKSELTFSNLVGSIRDIHDELAARAGRAVNISLTLRNWLIGYYIEEYERSGIDRAKYGDRLVDNLADKLSSEGVPRCDRRELYRYRRFYMFYPQIVEALTPQSQLLDSEILMSAIRKVRTLTAQLDSQISESHSGKSSENIPLTIVESVTPQFRLPGAELLTKLSYTHIAELLSIDDPLKRSFYELECIQGNWSVRELKRQINSLYYERSGLSKDKAKLAALAQENAETAAPRLAIRDPYVFEFLGLKPAEVMSESHLEDQLLDRIQDFLLELGHGFCFEARQKRILIGETHNFVDLVFYHRILKCHVLVELKLEEFNHENVGQLNTYVSWCRKNMITSGDNPPVGILLCTTRDHALAEYALAGMDNQLFVSKYLLELPKKEEMQRFIDEQMHELSGGGKAEGVAGGVGV